MTVKFKPYLGRLSESGVSRTGAVSPQPSADIPGPAAKCLLVAISLHEPVSYDVPHSRAFVKGLQTTPHTETRQQRLLQRYCLHAPYTLTVELLLIQLCFAGTRQAFLPGGPRTGAPGKHVVKGKAKYRLVDEQVRYFVAPAIEDIQNSPVSQYTFSCESFAHADITNAAEALCCPRCETDRRTKERDLWEATQRWSNWGTLLQDRPSSVNDAGSRRSKGTITAGAELKSTS